MRPAGSPWGVGRGGGGPSGWGGARERRVLPILLGINFAVFLLWQLPGLKPFMVGNFMTSVAHLEAGRVWTLVTSGFSHFELFHLLINMLVLWSFGTAVEARWGARRFAAFYLGACVFSSLVSALFVVFGWPDYPSLGASGATVAITTAFAIYHPRATVLIWGILPAPAALIVVAFAGFDVLGLIQQGKGVHTGIGHAAHLGGGIFSLIVMLVARRRTSPQTQWAP